MPLRLRTKRIRTLPGRAKIYEVQGRGMFSGLRKLARRTGKTFLKGSKYIGKQAVRQAKLLAPVIAKDLAPELVTLGANKLAEKAAQKGAPDFAVNLGTSLAQQGARKIRDSEGPKLSKNQKLVSDFISGKSADLLGDLLSRQGSGVRGFSGGSVRGFGGSVRGFGKGLTQVEAPTIN